MDPFHVVRLAGDALDRCRRRVQQDLHGHRGYAGDPLYRARRTLHTGEDLLTDRQRMRLVAQFAVEDHVEVEATWGIYQRMIAAYRDPDRTRAREAMRAPCSSGASVLRRAQPVAGFVIRKRRSRGSTPSRRSTSRRSLRSGESSRFLTVGSRSPWRRPCRSRPCTTFLMGTATRWVSSSSGRRGEPC